MPEELLKAVEDLVSTVGRLENTMSEYPKRREVEERFETKAEIKKKRHKAILITLGIALLGLVISFFVTVTTITSCFISEDARAGDASFGCKLLPGYTKAQEENRKLIAELRVLLDTPATNSERLDRLEKELGLPPLPEEGN
jgi:hypothetical protein